MKLSISNIAWSNLEDVHMYLVMRKHGYYGLEIAPTRIFPNAPYKDLEQSRNWSKRMKIENGIYISSMQSIWYGRREKIFGTKEEQEKLLNYTKMAINFANSINCQNLVFGCPQNRQFPEGGLHSTAVSFFQKLGKYASDHHVVIAMEANPTIYNTNYINDTMSAIRLVERVASSGFKLNLDVGTMIQNHEKVEILKGKICLINHVHISEPGLGIIQHRTLHQELAAYLRESNYNKHISIEMGQQDTSIIEETMIYVKEIFE